jgi:hypothetical protein
METPNPSSNSKRLFAESAETPENSGRSDHGGVAATYLHQARTAMEWLHPSLARDGVPAIRRYGKDKLRIHGRPRDPA